MRTGRPIPPLTITVDERDTTFTLSGLSARAPHDPLLRFELCVATPPARLGSGLPATALAGRDSHPPVIFNLPSALPSFLEKDALALRVRSAGKVVSVPVLTSVGVLADGEKQLLALELCGAESAEAWAGFVDAAGRRARVAPGCAATLLCAQAAEPGAQGAQVDYVVRPQEQRLGIH